MRDLLRELSSRDAELVARLPRIDTTPHEPPGSRWAPFSTDELLTLHAGLYLADEPGPLADELDLELGRRIFRPTRDELERELAERGVSRAVALTAAVVASDATPLAGSTPTGPASEPSPSPRS